MGCVGLVALQHVGSSRTRNGTHVPCIGTDSYPLDYQGSPLRASLLSCQALAHDDISLRVLCSREPRGLEISRAIESVFPGALPTQTSWSPAGVHVSVCSIVCVPRTGQGSHQTNAVLWAWCPPVLWPWASCFDSGDFLSLSVKWNCQR